MQTHYVSNSCISKTAALICMCNIPLEKDRVQVEGNLFCMQWWNKPPVPLVNCWIGRANYITSMQSSIISYELDHLSLIELLGCFYEVFTEKLIAFCSWCFLSIGFIDKPRASIKHAGLFVAHAWWCIAVCWCSSMVLHRLLFGVPCSILRCQCVLQQAIGQQYWHKAVWKENTIETPFRIIWGCIIILLLLFIFICFTKIPAYLSLLNTTKLWNNLKLLLV